MFELWLCLASTVSAGSHPPVPAAGLDAAVSILQCWGRRNALLLGFVVALLTMPCSDTPKSSCSCSLPLRWFLSIPSPLPLNCSRAGPWLSSISPVQVYPVGQESGSWLHPNYCASAGPSQLSCKVFNPGDCTPRAGSFHTKGHLVHLRHVQSLGCQELHCLEVALDQWKGYAHTNPGSLPGKAEWS